MKKFNWIKMGLKTIKISLIALLLSFSYSNTCKNAHIKTENFNLNMTLGLSAMAEKQEEKFPVVEEKPETKDETSKIVQTQTSSTGKSTYSGDLTGYAADCPACNGTLACKPKYNVYKNGVLTYPDSTYGNVRIVASSKKIPCGSVVKFNSKRVSKDPVYAIVLDRGVLGYDLDLLMPTEKDASQYIGRQKISYEIVRKGW